MKLYRLSLIAAVLLTFVMALVALVFQYVSKNSPTNYEYFIISILVMVIINYFVLEFLFNSYGKNQIRKISEIIPSKTENEEKVGFKELEERIQENVTQIDTMKEMEIYRKEYIGNVSHELKTPLFSIQGYVETLLEGGVENLNIRDKYLQRIDSSVERLLNIVTDLDMINQYESGEISLNYTQFDINSVIKEIADLLEIDAQKKNAKIKLQNSQNQLFVWADKQKISQVLLNLISNAVYYANRELAQITVKTSAKNSKILIEVQDNGMGIKPEILPRIFERFYRVETSRSRREGGSGLGLAIVKHILEAHQQNISVQSVYLEGTTFSFHLEQAN